MPDKGKRQNSHSSSKSPNREYTLRVLLNTQDMVNYRTVPVECPCSSQQGSQVSVSKCKSLSHARLFVTPWTAAHQALLSMRFSRQGYWSRLPFPSLGDLPDPGIKPGSPALQADCLPAELQGKPLQAR